MGTEGSSNRYAPPPPLIGPMAQHGEEENMESSIMYKTKRAKPCMSMSASPELLETEERTPSGRVLELCLCLRLLRI